VPLKDRVLHLPLELTNHLGEICNQDLLLLLKIFLQLKPSLELSHSSTLPNIRTAMSLVLQAYLSRGIRRLNGMLMIKIRMNYAVGLSQEISKPINSRSINSKARRHSSKPSHQEKLIRRTKAVLSNSNSKAISMSSSSTSRAIQLRRTSSSLKTPTAISNKSSRIFSPKKASPRIRVIKALQLPNLS